MLDDLAIILTGVGTASGALALLRLRARRQRAPWPVGAGARHLADALSGAAAAPLPVADSSWKSLAETLEP